MEEWTLYANIVYFSDTTYSLMISAAFQGLFPLKRPYYIKAETPPLLYHLKAICVKDRLRLPEKIFQKGIACYSAMLR
ncbi:hypothetical protein DBR32_02880 [Taibaiella sp. KBW10]|nr:hypothetical protein DBR32_02880 [Taibaiella sp. KBW10]